MSRFLEVYEPVEEGWGKVAALVLCLPTAGITLLGHNFYLLKQWIELWPILKYKNIL